MSAAPSTVKPRRPSAARPYLRCRDIANRLCVSLRTAQLMASRGTWAMLDVNLQSARPDYRIDPYDFERWLLKKTMPPKDMQT